MREPSKNSSTQRSACIDIAYPYSSSLAAWQLAGQGSPRSVEPGNSWCWHLLGQRHLSVSTSAVPKPPSQAKLCERGTPGTAFAFISSCISTSESQNIPEPSTRQRKHGYPPRSRRGAEPMGLSRAACLNARSSLQACKTDTA